MVSSNVNIMRRVVSKTNVIVFLIVPIRMVMHVDLIKRDVLHIMRKVSRRETWELCRVFLLKDTSFEQI